MLHKVRRHGRATFIRVLLAVVALLVIGLMLLSRKAAAQAETSWQARLDSAVAAEMVRTRTPGVQIAIAHRGRIIFAKSYGVADAETGRPVTDATLFRVGSVTKMVTGAVAAELAEQGKLDLRAPISRYVPSLEGKRVGAVTTHQLLTHTAGWLDNAVPYGRMGEGALGEVMREVSDTIFITEPGRIVSYSNPGYSMAGYVIERAAGERYGAVVDRMILRPVGMPSATFRPLEAMTRDFSQGHTGNPTENGRVVRPFTENTAQWAAGFLMASATDMARFAAMLMDGGMLDGQRVISENAVRRVITGDPRIPGNSDARYAYGVMVTEQDGRPVWQHGGSIPGFDALVTMLPRERLAIVVLDNRSGPSVSSVNRLVVEAITGVAPSAPAPARPERIATAAERAQLVGRYRIGPSTIEVAEVADSLVFRQNGASFGLRMLGDARVRVMVPAGLPPAVLDLVRDADGRVVFFHQGMRAIPRAERAP